METPTNSNLFRPTEAVIDLDALRHNLALAKQLAGAEVSLMGVVKANGYGHGAVAIAKTWKQGGFRHWPWPLPVKAKNYAKRGCEFPCTFLAAPFRPREIFW